MKEDFLKPVIFFDGKYDFHRQNDFKQRMVLKALQVTDDPEAIRKMAGLRSVAEVYRTLDKLAIRKEYHEALARQGISLDLIVKNIKDIGTSDESSPAIKLKAWNTILKSLGLDEYKEMEKSSQSWQTMLKEKIDRGEIVIDDAEQEGDYKVIEPPMPQDEKDKLEAETKAGRRLFE